MNYQPNPHENDTLIDSIMGLPNIALNAATETFNFAATTISETFAGTFDWMADSTMGMFEGGITWATGIFSSLFSMFGFDGGEVAPSTASMPKQAPKAPSPSMPSRAPVPA